MVRVPVASFKHSKLATACSIIGTAVLVVSLRFLIDDAMNGKFQLWSLLGLIIGVGLLLGAGKIGEAAFKRKVKKAMEEPGFAGKVKHSAQKAYFLLQQYPHKIMLEFIMQHNAPAGKLILQRLMGVISEEELTQQLRQLDRIAAPGRTQTSVPQTGVPEQPASDSDRDREKYRLEAEAALKTRLARRKTELQGIAKKNKLPALISVCACSLAVLTLIVCFALSSFVYVGRAAKDPRLAKEGNYTKLEVDGIRRYKEEDGYFYYEKDMGGYQIAKFRIPETEARLLRSSTAEEASYVYGYVKQIGGEVVMDGSIAQETVGKLLVPQPWTPIAGLFAVASGSCLVIFGRKYMRACKELKQMQAE